MLINSTVRNSVFATWNKIDVKDVQPILSRLTAIAFALHGDHQFINEQKILLTNISNFSQAEPVFSKIRKMLKYLDESAYPLVKEMNKLDEIGSEGFLHACDNWLFYYLTTKANNYSRDRLINFLGEDETNRILGPLQKS